MTDNNEKQELPEPETPEMTTFKVNAQRVFEVDFSQEQLQRMMNATGADTAKGAVQQRILQVEVDTIEPSQKLIGADVQVNEASNN